MLCCGATRSVRLSASHGMTGLMMLQIEYLVVTFDDQDRQVKLSLRQADILEALANDAELIKQGGGVPALNEGTAK